MSGTLTAMLLVFASMLPFVPVRVYVPPYWQHLLGKAERGFILACMILFVPVTNTNFWGFMGGYVGIVLVAPSVGMFASWLLTKLVLRNVPELKNPPSDTQVPDPLFDWRREAVEYKVKRLLMPYICGAVIAVLLYYVLR